MYNVEMINTKHGKINILFQYKKFHEVYIN